MTYLVYHDVDLSELIAEDMEFAEMEPTTPIASRFQRKRFQSFYVLEDGAEVPREMEEDQYIATRRSAVRLPPTVETIDMLGAALKAMCPGRCTLIDIRFIECDEGRIIYYAIKARINRHKQ